MLILSIGFSRYSNIFHRKSARFICHILYKASCFVASQLSQLSHVTDFVGLTRRSPHRITLRVCGCGSLPRIFAFSRCYRIAPCSYLWCHILYKASCFVASQLSHLSHVFAFSRCYRIAPCSYMLASFKHAVLCACFACPKTACLTTALYSNLS